MPVQVMSWSDLPHDDIDSVNGREIFGDNIIREATDIPGRLGRRRCDRLSRVTIGGRSVIGAGSLVLRDVPPDTVVAGKPARVVRALSL